MSYFLAGKMENVSISLLRLGRALKTRSVKAIKKVKEQKALVCQFNVVANGMNTKFPKSHTRRAAKRF